jgi:hypothetical protein
VGREGEDGEAAAAAVEAAAAVGCMVEADAHLVRPQLRRHKIAWNPRTHSTRLCQAARQRPSCDRWHLSIVAERWLHCMLRAQ